MIDLALCQIDDTLAKCVGKVLYDVAMHFIFGCVCIRQIASAKGFFKMIAKLYDLFVYMKVLSLWESFNFIPTTCRGYAHKPLFWFLHEFKILSTGFI